MAIRKRIEDFLKIRKEMMIFFRNVIIINYYAIST